MENKLTLDEEAECDMFNLIHRVNPFLMNQIQHLTLFFMMKFQETVEKEKVKSGMKSRNGD